jgi:Membrane-associated lipoprotein involved in thiamine biosynthesis
MAFGKESFPLWGGTATLLVTEPARLHSARRAVDRVIADVDAACSTYRDDSELALVHAAGGRPVRVSATFHAVLWTALNAAEVTESLIDPLACSGRAEWRSIRIDEPVGTVALPDGAILDFGSAGLAFAADRAAELAAGEEGCGVLFALGGDLAVAGPIPEEGWPVRVNNDHRSGDGRSPSGQDITLWMPGGLATSSLAGQARTLPSGRNVMHILNPRSGLPVHGPMAHHLRRGRKLRGCRHGEHRGHCPGARRRGLVDLPRAAGATGARRRMGDHGRGLARRHHRPAGRPAERAGGRLMPLEHTHQSVQGSSALLWAPTRFLLASYSLPTRFLLASSGLLAPKPSCPPGGTPDRHEHRTCRPRRPGSRLVS